MKKLNVFLVLALVVLTVSAALPVLAAGNGTGLSATKTAAGGWERVFPWTVDKSATPDTLNLFTGDSGMSTYTISVTKGTGINRYFVAGQVCVTNTGSAATEGLAISDVLEYNPGGGFRYLSTTSLDLSAKPVLAAGETYCYPYKIEVAFSANATYRDTANVTILNHSGSIGIPKGPSPSAATSLPLVPTLINDTINVDDSSGSSWRFSASGSQSYQKTFVCDGDEGAHGNTATIRQTGQSDNASVQVNCYALEVTKDAAASFDRTYSWSIAKSADQSALTLAIGQTSAVNYSVEVNTTGSTDSNWAVSGNITVHNPAPMAATINSVSDVVSEAIAATVKCGVDFAFPYTLAAGGNLVCAYTASLPDATSRTNTATATLQNTPSGTTDFSGTAAVDFGSATINEIDECVDIADTLGGTLGTVCADDVLPKTFTYSYTVGPYATCGEYSVNNTATFTTYDTNTTASSGVTIAVNVPCPTGCTLTQGYWGTHSKYGPARYDSNWTTVGEDTPFFLSGTSWYGAITAVPEGNAYWILSNQYVAAILNQKKGTFAPAGVQTALNAATSWLGTAVANDCVVGGSCETQKDWAATLDLYNRGMSPGGPAHCE